MKSEYELNYEKIVTALILSYDNSIHDQFGLFMDFHRNSCIYYDSLCDALYALANGHTSESLCISSSGKPYFASESEAEKDFLLLTHEQIPAFEDDLKDQLETALAKMRGLSAKQNRFRLDFVSTM